MKASFYRILTIVLTVILVATLAFSVFAANKATGTKDGLYVTFTTDKEEYTASETISANLQIINNASSKADVNVELQLPDSLQVSSGSASQTAAIESGAMWNAETVTLTYTGTSAEESNLSWIWWVVAGVVIVAGVVLLLIYGKNLKSHVSILLLMAMVLSFVTMAMPVSAEAEQNSFDVVNEIEVDGVKVELTAHISYTLAAVVVDDEEIDDGRLLAFFFNDFENPDRWHMDGATVTYNENVVDEAMEENGNHYGFMEMTSATTIAAYQADLKNSRVCDHLVFRVDISTNSYISKNSYVQYRYDGKTNYKLFVINQDGSLKIAGEDFPEVVVEKGKWLQLEFVFDFTHKDKDTADVYVNDKKLTTVDLPQAPDTYAQKYFRLYQQRDVNASATWLYDNIAIYESDKRLPLDQIKSPKIPVGERRTVAPDVEMIHPQLSDLGKDAVAILAGSKTAYANEGLAYLSAEAQAVTSNNAIIDVKVPGAFLKEYLGATGLDDNTLYSVKENAGGKNVLVDSRGAVIVSTKKLDPVNDIKLITMVYGYLKTGILANNYAAAPTFTQSAIDEACDLPMVPFNAFGQTAGNLPCLRAANGLYYLLLATRMDNTAKASDGTLLKDEVLRRIRFLIAGGNEPHANAGIFWDHATVGCILALAKNTPLIWNSLTKEEHSKMDLLMECLAIASNWGYNAQNDFRTGLDFRGNFSKHTTNNFKTAAFPNYLNAVMYFGSPEKVDEIFLKFDHSDYIARLKKAGFTNILVCWTHEDLFGVSIGMFMEYGGEPLCKRNDSALASYYEGAVAGGGAGVKVAWSTQDEESKVIYGKEDFIPVTIDFIEQLYKWAVISSYGVPGGMTYSHIVGDKKSPYQGQMGMMLEFASESEGRSKVGYCLHTVLVFAELMANVKLLGYWDYDKQTPETAKRMREMENRLYVGQMDFFYKLGEGYIGSSKSVSWEEYESTYYYYGTNYSKDIWLNFHFMDNQVITMDSGNRVPFLEPAAEPMNGITERPASALYTTDRTFKGNMIPAASQHIIDGKCYYEGKMEFDLTIGQDTLDEAFSGLVLFGTEAKGDRTLGEYAMRIYLNNGEIMVYNEDGYDAMGVRFGANYRFHFSVNFNGKTKRYDVTVTQTWPKTDKPITATLKDCWFATGKEAPYVNMIVPVWYSPSSPFWVENVTISGKTRAPSTYSPYRELDVKIDWSEVPASKRPSSVKAYLVYNGMKQQYKYVTLKASDGWKVKTLDHLPKTINKNEPIYTIAVDPIPGYLAICSEIKNDTITITVTSKPVLYQNDFQDGTLGKINDHSDKGSEVYIETEGKNKYLVLDNKFNTSNQLNLEVDNMYIDGKLNSLYNMFFFEMDMKKASKDSVVTGYAVSYRKDKVNGKEGTDPHQLVRISKNKVQVCGADKTYTIGALTDEWQTLKVYYDVANNRALISYGSENNYIIVENLPENRANKFGTATYAGACGLALDNMKIHCDSSKSIDGILNNMKTSITVNVNWDSNIPAKDIPDTFKAYLTINGKVSDKYVTLSKADGWKSQTFNNLSLLVNGATREYSVVPEYLIGLMPIVDQVGDKVSVNIYNEYTYYDNDFSDCKVTTSDKRSQIADKNQNILSFSGGVPTVAGGSNPYIVLNNVSGSVTNAAMENARSLFINMKLKAENIADAGRFVLRYILEDGKYNAMFEAEAKNGLINYSFFGKAIGQMTQGEWLNLEIRFDLENNVCMLKVDDGEWNVANGCPAFSSNKVCFYINKVMNWGIDDLKIRTDASWTTGDTAKTTVVNAKVNWDGTPALSAVRVNLLCNGKKVSGKTLTLNADNNWSGQFVDLPTRDALGQKLVYTTQLVDTAEGYNVYLTGNGNTINFTKMKHYYWNDFAGMTTTDCNGVVPSISGSVSYLGDDDIYMGYQKTSLKVNDDAIKTAKNVMLSMKLRVDQMAGRAEFDARYATADTKDYKFFKVSVNSAGTKAGFYLADTYVGAFDAGVWHDILIVYDQQSHKVFLYDGGTLVGGPVSVDANISNNIKLSGNVGSLWGVDDLRMFTDDTWDFYAQYKTNVEINVAWQDNDNAEGYRPEQLDVSLLADGTPVQNVTVYANGAWTATVSDLPEYNSATGEKITYTVSTSADKYKASYTGNNITMSLYLPGLTVDETYEIVWEDRANALGYRPSEVTLQLYANGVAVEGKTLVVKGEDNWKGTFEALPKYNEQTMQEYVYTVRVSSVEYYIASYNGNQVTMKSSFKIEAAVVERETPIAD